MMTTTLQFLLQTEQRNLHFLLLFRERLLYSPILILVIAHLIISARSVRSVGSSGMEFGEPCLEAILFLWINHLRDF